MCASAPEPAQPPVPPRQYTVASAPTPKVTAAAARTILGRTAGFLYTRRRRRPGRAGFVQSGRLMSGLDSGSTAGAASEAMSWAIRRTAARPGLALRRRQTGSPSWGSFGCNLLRPGPTPSCLRRIEIFEERLLSSTKVSGQTALIRSCRGTNSPRFSTRIRSTSTAFGSRATIFSPVTRR